VDRVAILEQLSYNPGVISMYTGKEIKDFNYTLDDICEVIRKTTDLIMPPCAPLGKDQLTTDDGFIFQNDNWTRWHVSRPFNDEVGARDWLIQQTLKLHEQTFDRDTVRQEYRDYMTDLQSKIGDTVILNYSYTRMCTVYDSIGLEIFTFFHLDYPEVLNDYMQIAVEQELQRIHAVADKALTPVVLIPEDFATKQGPIFAPDFLQKYHREPIKRLVDAWHEHGIKVIFHSDGNWKKAVPDLLACGVDGFYCLEPNCGMDIVELKNAYPQVVWSGGVDGVNLMERGVPADVRNTVHRHIYETNALNTGGMFVATSSEINPQIKPENFKAMVEAVGEIVNPDFVR
ncbi:MAG TPA: uroporphyrinogen decarboxylase family protein, partial [Syntrophomonas sp.]|nr:uroporphyrinogen decarboxylase family protein [Syntrophomonas sp.]